MTRPSLHDAVAHEQPLQVVGVINAYCAMLAQRAGFGALYISGAGVANASFGLPDLGVTSLADVCEDVRRIAGATDRPILVDVDTGFGGPLMIERTVRELARAGAAGLHLEDQVAAKRCGHRDGKTLVGADEMIQRLRAAVSAKPDDDFVVMARTDAYALEPMEAVLERIARYVQAGADMIFLEAVQQLDDFRPVVETAGVPVLANLTEFGKTPMWTLDELRSVGVGLALYPLTAFRAMSAAAEKTYQTLRQAGTQQSLLDQMQTRESLYDILGYHAHEKRAQQHNASPPEQEGAEPS